jgi:hypothetical protein
MAAKRISDYEHMGRLPVTVTLGGARFEVEPPPFRVALKCSMQLLEVLSEHGITEEMAQDEAALIGKADVMADVLNWIMNVIELDAADREVVSRYVKVEEIVTAMGIVMEMVNPSMPATGATTPATGEPKAGSI